MNVSSRRTAFLAVMFCARTSGAQALFEVPGHPKLEPLPAVDYQAGPERPDGLIVVALTERDPGSTAWADAVPVLVDPRDGFVEKLGKEAATALAIVPGGISVDPWSGDAAQSTRPGTGSVTPVVAPQAPTGGTEVLVESSCQSVGGDGSQFMVLWVLGTLRISRRRRPKR